MAMEYGIKHKSGEYSFFPSWDLQLAIDYCKEYSYPLIAREVSEPYVVSIRD